MTEGGAANNFRNSNVVEPTIVSSGGHGSSDTVLRTPFVGNIRALPPPLPQPPMSQTYGNSYGGMYGNLGSGMFNSGYSNYGGYGGYGGYSGYGGMGGYGGYGGYNSFGGYNRFGNGMNPMDPEARFIQMAENSSRPAFESIESLVSAIGNIAAMLDSTFFALTSSFRAILGVAANFGRLRGVFAQFWQTFAIFRGLHWIYKKILYWLHLTNVDPSSKDFNKVLAEAINENSTGINKFPRKRQSPWPVIAFLSFIFTAPYLIMRLLGTVTNTAHEEARIPSKWINPIETVALYDFNARNANELSMTTGARIMIAPKEIQNTVGLLNTGWALATIDGETSGMIPINFVKSPQQMRQERQQLFEGNIPAETNMPYSEVQQPVMTMPMPTESTTIENTEPQMDVKNLSVSAFPTPPQFKRLQLTDANQKSDDFQIAPQPIGPTNIQSVEKLNEEL